MKNMVVVEFTPSEAYEVLKILEDLDAQGIPGVTGLNIHDAHKKVRSAHEKGIDSRRGGGTGSSRSQSTAS